MKPASSDRLRKLGVWKIKSLPGFRILFRFFPTSSGLAICSTTILALTRSKTPLFNGRAEDYQPHGGVQSGSPINSGNRNRASPRRRCGGRCDSPSIREIPVATAGIQPAQSRIYGSLQFVAVSVLGRP